jgi:hypothetical protein
MSFDGDLYPTAGATSVMSVKGDMVDFDAIRQRLAIGSANQILQVKSSLPSWQTVPLADTVLTTAGDILYENATPELARLGIATNGDVLTLAGGLPSWATPSGGATTVSNSISDFTNSQTTTSTSYVAVAGGTAITQSGSSGICVVTGFMTGENATAGNQIIFIVSDDGTAVGKGSINQVVSDGSYLSLPIAYEMDNNGSAIDVMWKVGGATGLLTNGGGTSHGCLCTVSEIS